MLATNSLFWWFRLCSLLRARTQHVPLSPMCFRLSTRVPVRRRAFPFADARAPFAGACSRSHTRVPVAHSCFTFPFAHACSRCPHVCSFAHAVACVPFADACSRSHTRVPVAHKTCCSRSTRVSVAHTRVPVTVAHTCVPVAHTLVPSTRVFGEYTFITKRFQPVTISSKNRIIRNFL